MHAYVQEVRYQFDAELDRFHTEGPEESPAWRQHQRGVLSVLIRALKLLDSQPDERICEMEAALAACRQPCSA